MDREDGECLEFAAALDTVVLRSSTMESVRHISAADEGTRPGMLLRTLNKDLLMEPPAFKVGSKIKELDIIEDDIPESLQNRKITEKALYVSNKRATLHPVFTERRLRTFVSHFLKEKIRNSSAARNERTSLGNFVDEF